jgi:hypothetical protein
MPKENTNNNITQGGATQGKFRVKFETGQSVTFDKRPSPEDIDEVANKLKLTKPSQQVASEETQQAPVSGRSLLPSGKEATTGQKVFNTVADIAGSRGFGETIGGLIAQPQINKTLEDSNKLRNEQRDKVVSEIPRLEAEGKDTTRLRELLAESGESLDALDVNPVLRKTNKQVLGEALEFGAGSVGAIAGGGGLSQIGKQALKGSVPGIARAVGKQSVRSGIEGTIGGFGVGLQDQEAGLGKAFGTAALGGGLGAALGSGIVGRGVKNIVGGTKKLTEGLIGKTTGVGDDVIREAVDIVEQGGFKKKAFKDALRGKISADEIVEDANSSLRTLKQRRAEQFTKDLSSIDNGKTINTSNVDDTFSKVIEDFDLKIGKNGTVTDFGAIARQNDRVIIQNVVDKMRTFNKGPKTVRTVNNLRFFLQDSFTEGAKSGAFTDRLRKQIRQDLGEQVPGFNKLQDNFSESTNFIQEIEKMLSVGDKKNRDTAFRKIVGSLRNNNEIRQKLIREFDELTGGALTAKISGQQLSEAISRGLVGSLGAPSVLASAASGAVSPIFLVSLLGLSPRFVGEAINALRLPLRVSSALKVAINNIADGIGRNNIGLLGERLKQAGTKEVLRNKNN